MPVTDSGFDTVKFTQKFDDATAARLDVRRLAFVEAGCLSYCELVGLTEGLIFFVRFRGLLEAVICVLLDPAPRLHPGRKTRTITPVLLVYVELVRPPCLLVGGRSLRKPNMF